MGKFSYAMQQVSKRRPELLQSAARSAQLRALRETIAPEVKVSRYSALRYQVLQASEQSIPLGDSVVLAKIDAPREYTTLVGSDDRLLALYLPLSPSAVLCGHSPDFYPSLNELPLAIARCSLEYYVSHDCSPHLEQYQTRIAELADVLDDESVERLLTEAFDE
ncbi:hypothetical protein LP415_08510 [Polaromonas sp. P1(28)-8]|nr:hypothetical protein LP415_08510 [Polaromonas sp. P1(28)-8]